MSSFDYLLFQWLNGFAGASAIFDAIIIFSGMYLIFIIAAAVLAIIWRAKSQERLSRVFYVLASIILGEALVWGARFLYQQPRPFELLDVSKQLLYHTAGNALPSGHATAAFALATAVFLWSRKWGLVLYAAALLVGISRIIGGIHWPTDIIAGAIIGSWSALMAYAILWRKERGRE
ncbi:MAG TPA: phosphatase PAP2 family protein [Candidatus Paceibacterota bacterium]